LYIADRKTKMIQSSMRVLTGLIKFNAKGISSKGLKILIFVHSSANIIPTLHKDEKVT